MAGESISFIPKTAVPRPAYQQRSFGFLVTVAVVALLVSLGIFGGAYVYKGLLDSDIEKSRADLEKIKKEFEITSIRSFSQMASSIDAVKTAINSHTATSKIFRFLQENVLPSARFLDLNFSNTGKPSIVLGGEAASFTALAEQSYVINNSKYVRSMALSDLSLRRSGNIGFKMTITFDPAMINYLEEKQP